MTQIYFCNSVVLILPYRNIFQVQCYQINILMLFWAWSLRYVINYLNLNQCHKNIYPPHNNYSLSFQIFFPVIIMSNIMKGQRDSKNNYYTTTTTTNCIAFPYWGITSFKYLFGINRSRFHIIYKFASKYLSFNW